MKTSRSVCVVFLMSKLALMSALSTSRRKIPLRMGILDDFTSRSAVNGLLENALTRAGSTLKTKEDYYNSQSLPNERNYAGNPCVQVTALAHLQWETVLKPGVDAAIDATCGNGHDAAFLAEKLFSSSDPGQAELYCIDIQAEACETTRKRLESKLDSTIMESHVQIRQTSHAPLARTKSPLALVCWNLGYLPKSVDKSTYTQMESTIESISDAAIQLRVGGLLSVVTYPTTNGNEDYAVHALFECLALLTSVDTDWREFVEQLGPDLDDPSAYRVKEVVSKAIYRIVDNGFEKQTWRVMEHKTMGRPLSPIYLSATRIK